MRGRPIWLAVVLAGIVSTLIVTATENAYLKLAYTTPTSDAANDGCGPGGMPIDDLDWIELWCVWSNGDTGFVAMHQVTEPGAPDTFTIARVPQLRAVWVVAVDSFGNRSCRSNPLFFGQMVDVPPQSPEPIPAPTTGRRELFDLAGRRVDQPVRNGVYFERVPGRRTMRVVVIR